MTRTIKRSKKVNFFQQNRLGKQQRKKGKIKNKIYITLNIARLNQQSDELTL